MTIPNHVKTVFERYPEYRLYETDNGIEVEYADALWPLVHPLDIELGAYRTNWQSNAFYHLRKAHHIAWPQLIPTWHDWTEQRFQEFCEPHKVMTWAAGASAGKSMDAGCLALLFWWANCTQRTVLVGSTTIGDLDNRIFGYIKKLHDIPNQYEIPVPGHLYTSAPPKIILDKKDTIHGLFTIALLKGTDKAGTSTRASNLIGRHPEEGFLAIIDEGPDVSASFIDAFSNWDKAPLFKCIVIGNSNSMYDPHGLLSTPVNGWGSVSPDYDTKWITRMGVCLYFDCYRSPAITEIDPEKKKVLSKFLATEESIEKDKRDYGENSHAFWRMSRGFWPPEDVAQTILSPLTLDKHKARTKPSWSGETELIKVASLDPAFSFGGDACVLRFADIGKDTEGRWIIDFGGPDYINYLKLDARSSEPIDYQIITQSKQLCLEAGVEWANVAVDVNGTGMGLGSIIIQNWSREVMHVDSVGLPSELRVSAEKEILAKDVYDRKVTELWFMLQKFILANQIRGLDDKTCEQLCTRRYTWVGKKLSIEKKTDYKHRMGKVDSRYKSPDEADACCFIIELVRHRFGLIPHAAANIPSKVESGWRKFFNAKKLLDGDAQNNSYATESELAGNSFSPLAWDDGFTVDQFSEQDK